jgi:uncharacterized membrane protein
MTTPRTLQLRMVIGVLALVGLFVALYLALYETQLSDSLACPLGGQCETVNTSQYVNMFVIPIGVIGVIGYSAILVLILGWTTRRRLAGDGSSRRPAWARNIPWAYNILAWIPVSFALIGMATFGFLFSMFLTYLEVFAIRAICTWCAVSTGLMTVIFGLSAWAWLAERTPQQKSPARN